MTPKAEPRFGLQRHQVFWNERGCVLCACCSIPYPGSDTWIFEHWEEITPEILAQIDKEGTTVACESCGRVPRRTAS